MLFSSFFFVLVFLPASLLIYFGCCKISPKAGLWALLGLSSIFYAWGNAVFLILIYFSILFNYYAAKIIQKSNNKSLFGLFIGANVALLLFFKYSSFLIENINALFALHIPSPDIPLPLAISFLTFHQIWFLVGTYRRRLETPFHEFRPPLGEAPSLLEFANYITFFPHLIAGPIVRHTDYFPQLGHSSVYSLSLKNTMVGATIFVVGLFKKTVLADSAGLIADPVFGMLAQGASPNMIEAWMGVFSYSFQIYFDFSGYSDMAIGLARMFNIFLPCNFLSPYQSESFIEFWRRWHISLSTFLKEHIYIPLGGNRKGPVRRYANLFVTMLIGGLWHGASWTFVAWGALHGIFLALNHLLRAMIKTPLIQNAFLKRVFVFLCVSMIWIFFRAGTFSEAARLLHSLFDPSGFGLPAHLVKSIDHVLGVSLPHLKISFSIAKDGFNLNIFTLVSLFFITFFLPNVYEWMAYFRPAKYFVKSQWAKSRMFKRICWKPTLAYGILILLLFSIAFGNIDSRNEFIYFRF